ncbi:MAG: ABC transporter permease, partial [Lachnospiraceae bacterium]|nr:ABC transporter permease [Lachnospiraceae bacterium]
YYGSEDKKDSIIFQSIIKDAQESGIVHGKSYCVPEELFPFLKVTEGTFDIEKFRQGGYALLDGDRDSVHWIHPGDKITLGSYDDGSGQERPSRELEVMAVVELPYAVGTKSLTLGGAGFILSPEDFEGLYETRGYIHGCISVEPEREDEVIGAVNEMLSENYPDLVLLTKDSLRKEFSRENQMFSVIGGLLGFILGLIGILNLINAMITSILSRKQEFAMMQAVGMTGKQLEQMLTMEGIWYGIWTLLVSATLGNVVSYGLIYMLGRNMRYFVWSFHILPLAVSVPVIAVVSVILPVICYHTLCKKSIIERLRLAEV